MPQETTAPLSFADGRYEVSAMVPHRPLTPYTVGDKERTVVSRAGVSGGTWLDIWLPGLVEPAMAPCTRVAPIAHSGELLGLIVCEWPADRAVFTELMPERARAEALQSTKGIEPVKRKKGSKVTSQLSMLPE